MHRAGIFQKRKATCLLGGLQVALLNDWSQLADYSHLIQHLHFNLNGLSERTCPEAKGGFAYVRSIAKER
jgi:hypothetical protein